LLTFSKYNIKSVKKVSKNSSIETQFIRDLSPADLWIFVRIHSAASEI